MVDSIWSLEFPHNCNVLGIIPDCSLSLAWSTGFFWFSAGKGSLLSGSAEEWILATGHPSLTEDPCYGTLLGSSVSMGSGVWSHDVSCGLRTTAWPFNGTLLECFHLVTESVLLTSQHTLALRDNVTH